MVVRPHLRLARKQASFLRITRRDPLRCPRAVEQGFSRVPIVLEVTPTKKQKAAAFCFGALN